LGEIIACFICFWHLCLTVYGPTLPFSLALKSDSELSGTQTPWTYAHCYALLCCTV